MISIIFFNFTPQLIIFLMKRIVITSLLLILGVSLRAQETQFVVTSSIVTIEEFQHAYSERGDYNYMRETSIPEDVKSEVVRAVYDALSDEERECIESGDLYIENIGRYTNGLYAADIFSYGYDTFFFDANLVPYDKRAQKTHRAAYSTDGIFVGCDIFDCDPRIHLTFYRVNGDNTIMELAEYIDLSARLPYIDYEDDLRLPISKEYIDTPIFWCRGALYFIAIASDYNSAEVVYYRLDCILST